MCFAPQRRAFFISHLARWLRTRRFSEPTFRPSGATNHWKNTVFRDFPTFSRTWIFFLRRLSLFDLLSSSLLFSDSSHLCFSSVHIVGSLTSKLPSTTTTTLQLRSATLHYTTTATTATLHYTTEQLQLQRQLHYITLHCTTTTTAAITTLRCTTLHYTTLHYTTLHYTTLH